MTGMGGDTIMEVWDEGKCFGDSMMVMDLCWFNVVVFSTGCSACWWLRLGGVVVVQQLGLPVQKVMQRWWCRGDGEVDDE